MTTTPADDLHVVHVPTMPSPDSATESMVRMRDGVRLAADVYLPEADGPFETVLIRTPYDKAGVYTYMPEVAPHFTRRGYAVVVQDVRGKFSSEGVALPWVNEVADGHDTLSWIAQQPWSDGRVGMWGESYYGFTQWAAVSSRHPALKAIVPRLTGTRLGGPLGPDLPEWFIDRTYRCSHFAARETYEWQPAWRRPLAHEFERFFALVGERSPAWDLDFPHPTELRRFPEGHPFDATPVPTLLVLGWFDNCAHFGWADHAELLTRPDWSQVLHLRVEAHDHEGYHHASLPIDEASDHMNDHAIRQLTIARLVGPALGFFDRYLRRDPEAPEVPRVSWEQVNAGAESASQWPPPGATPQHLQLVAGASLSTGHLSVESSSDPVRLTWVHDPDAPVPSPYENTFALLREYPDERFLSERADVLTFDSRAVDADVDLCGAVDLDLTVGTTGSHIDVFARLLDLDEDGSAHLIARGQTRVRPGEGMAGAHVSLAHLGYRLRPGHRLRLLVASSDFPEYVVNPGHDEHPWLTVKAVTNEQTVVLGGPDAARLRLTLAPGSPPLS